MFTKAPLTERGLLTNGTNGISEQPVNTTHHCPRPVSLSCMSLLHNNVFVVHCLTCIYRNKHLITIQSIFWLQGNFDLRVNAILTAIYNICIAGKLCSTNFHKKIFTMKFSIQLNCLSNFCFIYPALEKIFVQLIFVLFTIAKGQCKKSWCVIIFCISVDGLSAN